MCVLDCLSVCMLINTWPYQLVIRQMKGVIIVISLRDVSKDGAASPTHITGVKAEVMKG